MEKSFGDFLKQKRQEKNLTQKELAKALFVSESAVSKWEKDVAHPDITLLPKLSEILSVSEHELITASIDKTARTEKIQAKKWRTLSFTWSLFFYIAYGVALIPCFICNLAIDKTLSWFWIVASSLLLAFTFTNLPKLIKKYKLLFIPLSQFLTLCLLLGVCCNYTNGSWFWVAVLSVFLGLLMIFTPIYISKYKVFSKIKKANDFVTVAICFIFLNVLLIVIDGYTFSKYSVNQWYLTFALPIAFVSYVILNLFLCVRFLKFNKLIKTSVILFMVNFFVYIVPIFIKTKNPFLQNELNDLNVFKANLSRWSGVFIERNVHSIIFLTILTLSLIFLVFGVIKYYKKQK